MLVKLIYHHHQQHQPQHQHHHAAAKKASEAAEASLSILLCSRIVLIVLHCNCNNRGNCVLSCLFAIFASSFSQLPPKCFCCCCCCCCCLTCVRSLKPITWNLMGRVFKNQLNKQICTHIHTKHTHKKSSTVRIPFVILEYWKACIF